MIATVYTEHRLVRSARDRCRPLRHVARAPVRADRLARAGRRDPRRGHLGRAVRVGYRSGHHRTRGRPRHERVSAGAHRPRASDGDDALVPRAAHARARTLGAAECCVRDLGERAASVQASSLDQLRDRAAVRARERGHPPGRAAARRRCHVSRDAGNPVRLRGRQAARDPRRGVARVAARRAAPGAELAGDRRGRGRRRHRVHGLAADLEPRLRRPAARRGEARRARGSRVSRRSWPGPCSG